MRYRGRLIKAAFLAFCTLAGCSGGGGGSPPPVRPTSTAAPTTPTPTAAPTATVSGSPFLASFAVSAAANQPFLQKSTIASYALVGNWPQQLTLSPLDQYGKPFTGTVPALSVTSSDPSVTASIDATTALTVDVVEKSLAASIVQVTVRAGSAAGSTTLETQQALWVGTVSGVTAYQAGNPSALYQLSGPTLVQTLGTDANGDLLVADGFVGALMSWYVPGGALLGTKSLSGYVGNIALTAGNCYTSGATILEFVGCNPSGTVTSIGFTGTDGIAFDSTGRVWIGNILELPTSAEDVYADLTFTTKLFSITDPYAGPGAVVFDSSGHAFVPFSGYGGGTPTGGNILEITVSGSTYTILKTLQASDGLVAPAGLALDAKQNLWVANFTNVVEFAAGTLTPISGSTITVASGDRALSVVFLPTH